MKRTKSLLLGLAAAVALIATPATAADKNKDPNRENRADRMEPAASDKTFVTKAAAGGLAEVQLAQLAQNKAQSQAVKDLANKLYTDHSKANDKLKSIAAKDNITLPASMDVKAQREYNRLNALSGDAFDREFVRHTIKDHKQDIEMFQREADHGTNADLKAWASENLPALREHLSMAQNAMPTSHSHQNKTDHDKTDHTKTKTDQPNK